MKCNAPPYLNQIHLFKGMANSGEKQVHVVARYNDKEANDTAEADTLEKVEKLIQNKRLPQDQTITIHSPESGTTIF